MAVQIEELRRWLLLKNEEIQLISKKEMTLMDIMGISHLENQWSKIYEFFFTTPSSNYLDHGFGDVFVRSLEELLYERGLKCCHKGWLNEFEVLTEYPCMSIKEDKNTYKRIDILLQEKFRKDNKQKAIIIENKVHHTLEGNNLALYAKTIFDKGYTDIILIVLTLNRIDDNNVYKEKGEKLKKLKDELKDKTLEYINITHVEYMKKIDDEIKNKSIAHSKYYSLYNDFKNNIMNQANVMTDEEYRLFNENYLNIKRVNALYKKIIENTYRPQLKNVFKDKFIFEFFDTENDTFIRLGYKEQEDVFLTIFIDRLWKEEKPYVTIILELQGEAMQKVRALENNDFPCLLNLRKDINCSDVKFHDDEDIDLLDDDKNKYMHYASWDEEIKEKRPDVFAAYLKNRIDDDFPIYKLGKKIIELIQNENIP